ncbi:MAG: hypothetical protein HZA90_01765 [Verrucomicrobia bacterium]|nr:hypothetical protein [Verrucomicrobiota bacterium]
MKEEPTNDADGSDSRPTLRAWPLLLVLVSGVLSLSACRDRSTTAEPAVPPPASAATNVVAATNAPAAPVAQPNPNFQKLLGQWVRPDGGYVLEIKNVDDQGRMQAAYLNPRPINVSRAEAKTDAGATKIFVELRDTGYPGCTYNLLFDPASDTLVGTYFQAAMQQEYSIMFERLKR